MIVLDASALVELLLNTARGATIRGLVADPGQSLHVPHLADVEVVHALRHICRDGQMTGMRAVAAVDDLRALDLQRHSHEPLLGRVWALRANLSAYDAVYVALAEALDALLITCDGRLARAPGSRARVRVVEA